MPIRKSELNGDIFIVSQDRISPDITTSIAMPFLLCTTTYEVLVRIIPGMKIRIMQLCVFVSRGQYRRPFPATKPPLTQQSLAAKKHKRKTPPPYVKSISYVYARHSDKSFFKKHEKINALRLSPFPTAHCTILYIY